MTFRIADALFWVAVAFCLVAQVAIVRSIVISSPTSVSPSGSESRTSRATELFWAVLPGLALAAVLVFTWRAMHPHA